MIIRNKDRKTFTVISNQAINDTQISDKALGTFVRHLSKPDNWNLNINYMAKTGKQGHTGIRSSIVELEKAGYIHKQLARHRSGQITGTQYHVYEDAVAGAPMPPPSRISPSSQVKTSSRYESQSQKNRSQETDPVINTNIEQTLRETTTTAPEFGSDSVIDVDPLEPPPSFPATESLN